MDNDKRETLRFILYGWDEYDETLTPEENLIELIIAMGFLDEAQELIEKYKRRRYK